MPEQRSINVYKDGVLIGVDGYIEVSDEQLYEEQLAAEMNAVHEQAILALKNWDSLTAAQKWVILKGLVKWALWKDGWLKPGVL